MNLHLPNITRSLAALTATALLCAGTSAMAQDKAWLADFDPITLRLADFSGDASTNFGKAMTAWEEAVTEYTEGKVTFENYWSASLLNANDMLGGIGSGVADIGLVIPSYYPQDLPVASWLFGMGAALTGSTVHDVAAGGATALETILTMPEVTAEYAGHNVRVLQGTSTPAYNLLCNKPISTLADAAGIRARAIGAVWSDTAEALGMTPVSIAFNEAYEGLQRGVFDCMVINPNQYADGLILKDVAPQFVPVTMAQLQASTFIINKDVWDGLPVELQAFMTEASMQAAYDIWAGYLQIEANAGDLIAAGDVIQTNDVSELEPVAAAQRAEYVANLASTAPAAIGDAQGVVDTYLERQNYWIGVLEELGHPVAERTPEAIMAAFGGLRDVDLAPFFERFKTEVGPSLMP